MKTGSWLWLVCDVFVFVCVQECLEVLCSHSEQDIERRDKCNRTIHDVATDDCKDLLENLSECSECSCVHMLQLVVLGLIWILIYLLRHTSRSYE